MEKTPYCPLKSLNIEKTREEAGNGMHKWNVLVQLFSLLSTTACWYAGTGLIRFITLSISTFYPIRL